MTPFAENTSLMFAEAAKVSRPFRAVNLRPYANVPEIDEFRELGRPVVRALEGLVLYSNQVVALNMSSKSDREKNNLLADYLQSAAGKVADREKWERLGITPSMLDSTLTSIRDSQTFLAGIGAASPIVNAVVLAILDRLDQLNHMIPGLILAIDAKINERYQAQRTAYAGLTRLQAKYLHAAIWLYDAESAVPGAVDSLLAIDPSMAEFLATPERATPEELAAAEAELVQRLARISAMIEQMSDDKAVYLATEEELEDLRLNLDERIKTARDAVVVWGQSHRNLGRGIPVPPMINVGAIAGGIVHTAVP